MESAGRSDSPRAAGRAPAGASRREWGGGVRDGAAPGLDPARGGGTAGRPRVYPPEFRDRAVSRVAEEIRAAGGDGFGVVARVAREVGVSASALRSWVRRADIDPGARRHPAAPRPVRDRTPEPAGRAVPRRRPRPGGSEDRRSTGDRHGAAGGRRGAGTGPRDAGHRPVPRGGDRLPGATGPSAPLPVRATPVRPDRARAERPPAAAVGEPGPRPAEAERWPRVRAAAVSLQRPLLAYLAARLIVVVVVQLVISRHDGGLAILRGPVPWTPVPSSGHFLDAFGVWDAGWYVHIATHGYVRPPFGWSPLGGDMAFFPLLPILIRTVSLATGLSPLAAGWWLTVFLGAGATAGVWYATRRVAGPRIADRAAVLWCLFPGAFALSLIYAEALTLIGATACLVALTRRRWLLAGLAAACATATQPVGLVLVLCCAWSAAAAVLSRREWRALVAPVLAPSGAAAYFGYLWARTGDATAWFHSEGLFWSQGKSGVYWTTVGPIRHLVQHPATLDDWSRVAGLGFVLVAAAVLWRWRPPATYCIWAVGTVLIALASAPVGARPRFLLAAFPLVAALAAKLPRPAVYALALVEAPLLALLTYVTITSLRVIP